MNILIRIALCAVAFGLWPKHLHAEDLYVEWENISAGTTDGSINMGTISHTNGSAVTFAHVGSADKMTVENGGMNYALLGPVTVGGVSYSNAFTKHLLVKSDSSVSLQQIFRWTQAASRKVSYGFFITISNFTGLGSFYTVGGVASGSDYSVLSLVNNSPPYFQNEGLTAPYGENINVPNNVPIWVTGLWDSAQATAANRSRMYFYNATNWTLIGWSIDPFVVQNRTVADFEMGIHDAHSKDAGTVYRLGAFLLDTNGTKFPLWPGSRAWVPTNSSGGAISAAITAATAGDYLQLAATNYPTITVGKQLSIGGFGSNQTVLTFDVAAQTDDGFYFNSSAGKSRMTNLFIKSVGNECRLVHVEDANDCLFSHLCLSNAYWGVYNEGRNLYHSSTFINLNKAVRNHGWLTDNSMWSTYYPVGNASTNRAFYEDCGFEVNSGAVSDGTRNMCSSQNAGIWTFRHCNFKVSAWNWSPIIDSHGDDAGSGLRGVLSDQIYKCDFIVSGTASIVGNLHDKRGGRGLCFSNTLSASLSTTIRLREEREGDTPNDRVEEYYFFDNDSDLTISIGSGNEDFIILDAHYFTHSPSGDGVQLYPHYLRTGIMGQQLIEPIAPPNWSTARLGPGRASIKSRSTAPGSAGGF